MVVLLGGKVSGAVTSDGASGGKSKCKCKWPGGGWPGEKSTGDCGQNFPCRKCNNGSMPRKASDRASLLQSRLSLALRHFSGNTE